MDETPYIESNVILALSNEDDKLALKSLELLDEFSLKRYEQLLEKALRLTRRSRRERFGTDFLAPTGSLEA